MSKDGWGLTMMEGSRGEEADAGVVMFLVVPVEEVYGEDTGVLDRAEARREGWPVLQGAELTL